MKLKNPYKKGADFEREVKGIYEGWGWHIFRSAGSHSIADLVAIRTGEVRFIQCKTNGKLHKNERIQLIELAKENNAVSVLAWKERALVRFEELLDEKDTIKTNKQEETKAATKGKSG